MPARTWLSPNAQRLAEDFAGDAEQAIRSHARRLLARSKAKGPPFYPDLLAKHCGVAKVLPIDGKQQGLLLRDGDTYTILVNKRYPIRSDQWNAICAHELGHILLGESAGSSWTKEEEYLSDIAARELLLPARPFKAVAGEIISADDGLSVESLVRLAEVFRAPARMTAIRVLETRIWRGLILHWKALERNGNEIALDWWYPAGQPVNGIRLKRNLTPREIFGEGNRIDQAWDQAAATAGVEKASVGRRSVWWFVRSGPFEEHGVRCVLSLVRLQ